MVGKSNEFYLQSISAGAELLLLDEPTNHLDIKHTFQILDLLKERQQTMGLTIFSILHDLNVASLYADRFALLHDGRLLEVGDVELLRKVDQLQKVTRCNERPITSNCPETTAPHDTRVFYIKRDLSL